MKSTLTLIIVLIIYGCGKSKKETNNTQGTEIVYNTERESKTIEIFGIKGEGIALRKGAGENFEKLVNQKATRILKKTVNFSIDYTCKVKIESEKNGWSKVIVVEPEQLSASHRGWVKTEHLLKSGKKKNRQRNQKSGFLMT